MEDFALKLWILRPQENLPKGDNPWNPWYDKAFGFVVCALDEPSARQIAQNNAGGECRTEFLGETTSKTTTPWLDPKYSTCVVLEPKKAGFVIQDFAAA